MRKPSKRELGILVGVIVATGLAHSEEGLPEIVVHGYQQAPFDWLTWFAYDYAPTPIAGSGPGGVSSATPNSHTNCVTQKLATAQTSAYLGGSNLNPPSQPTNTSLPIPIRYANPIDIANNSKIGASYGGVNGAAGFMVFPTWAAGLNAAIASAQGYSNSGYTITGLVNAWAPASVNPTALSNTLSGLGISATLANSTDLSSLTASQLTQVIAAFAWQEGFKPGGC